MNARRASHEGAARVLKKFEGFYNMSPVRRRFPPFTLDAAARQLFRDEAPVHLSRKAFDVLCVLIARGPEVVSKDALLAEVWPRTFVSEASLSVLIGEIRRALDDDARAPRFIRTVHGIGYAFCADALDQETAAPALEQPPAALAAGDRLFPLAEGDNVIGRDAHCRVWLTDAGVSRRHAVLRLTTAVRQVMLEDLGSTNGTFVKRRRITEPTPLADGDVVRVGPVALELRAWRADPARTRPLPRRRRG